ncbi:Wzz/FepE/Etk N-terminal domain-containing protein, partial [Micromonospora zhanjiangensis]
MTRLTRMRRMTRLRLPRVRRGGHPVDYLVVRPPGSRQAAALLQVFVVTVFVFPSDAVIRIIGAQGYLASLVAMLLFAGWATTALLGFHDPVHTRYPVRGALALLWICSLLSYAVMPLFGPDETQRLSADRWMMLLVGMSGVILVTAEHLRDPRDMLRVIRALVWGAAFSGTIALLQFWLRWDLKPVLRQALPGFEAGDAYGSFQGRDALMRVTGTALHPIELGVVAGMLLPLAVWLAMVDRERRPLRRWVPVGLIGMCVPMSVSRSAILAVAVAMGVFVVSLPPRPRAWAVFLAPVAVVGVFAGVPGYVSTIAAPVDHQPVGQLSPGARPGAGGAVAGPGWWHLPRAGRHEDPGQPVPEVRDRAGADRGGRVAALPARTGGGGAGGPVPGHRAGLPRPVRGAGRRLPGRRRGRVHLRRVLVPPVRLRARRPARALRHLLAVGPPVGRTAGCRNRHAFATVGHGGRTSSHPPGLKRAPMDLLALLTTLRRHKLLVLVVSLIMIAGDAFVAFGIPPQYESQAQFVLIAPPPPPTSTDIQRDPALAKVNADNPYLRLPNPSVVVDILAQRVAGDTVRKQLVAKGADQDYTITSTNAIGSGLVIDIVGTGTSGAQARRTLDLVSEAMATELHEMQKINGADDKYLFQALPINPPADPTRKVTGTVRSLIAVSAACLVLLFALVSIAEAAGPRRTRPVVPRDGRDDDPPSGGAP